MKDKDYIITYTGVHFHILNPHPDEIYLQDVSHALSLLCRANGHASHFFSVAQHSINCANEAKERNLSRRLQLMCLIHDVSEAYIADITRPLKEHLPNYIPIEAKLQNIIYEKFGVYNITQQEHDIIDDIDNAMLHYEFVEMMREHLNDKDPIIFSVPDFSERNPKEVESEFSEMLKELHAEVINKE